MRNITRRSAVNALVGAAGLSAIPVAASAMAPDPIFPAIERHKALNADFSRACRFEPLPTSTLEHAEWERRELETSDAEREACDELVGTVPTTLAGILALLRYVEHEHARGETFLDQDQLEELLSTTADAVQAIGGVS